MRGYFMVSGPQNEDISKKFGGKSCSGSAFKIVN